MKTLIKCYALFSRIIAIAAIFISLFFSCSKNTDTPTDVANHYCNNIDWNNMIGLSDYFTGVMTNGQYDLVALNINEDGADHIRAFHRTNNTSVIPNDQPGWTFTYEAGTLVKLVVDDASGTSTYTFDTDKHLTKTYIESSN